MIRYLAIRNLAVIESVAVDFEQSFNILTGETGAGKSILVEAVGLLLGGRATQDLIRTGEDLATVEAIFETEDGSELIVRREITSQGRSRAFINGALATAAALKDLSNRLVELHGQHEHQQLLDPIAAPRAARCVGRPRCRARRRRRGVCRRARRCASSSIACAWTIASGRRGSTSSSSSSASCRRPTCRPGEDETLAADRQLLRSADTIQRLCGESYAELYDTEEAALVVLGRVWKTRRRAGGDRSAVRAVPRCARRHQGAARRPRLHAARLRRRHRRVAGAAAAGRRSPRADRAAEAQARRHARRGDRASRSPGGRAQGADRRAVDRRGDRAAARRCRPRVPGRGQEAVGRAGARPRRSSRRQVEAELADLAMERTKFEVRLTTAEAEGQWTDAGIDSGELFLSPNVGEDLRPLAKIVSGGELSRVMLALKTLAAADAGAGQDPDLRRGRCRHRRPGRDRGRAEAGVARRSVPGALHHAPAADRGVRPQPLPDREARPGTPDRHQREPAGRRGAGRGNRPHDGRRGGGREGAGERPRTARY